MFGIRSLTRQMKAMSLVKASKSFTAAHMKSLRTPVSSTLFAQRSFSTKNNETSEEKVEDPAKPETLAQKIKNIQQTIKSTQMYEARLDPEDEKESEPIPIPAKHQRIFWLAFLLIASGIVATAYEMNPDEMVNPTILSEDEVKEMSTISYLYHTVTYNFVKTIQSFFKLSFNSKQTEDSTTIADKLSKYFSDPANRNPVKVFGDTTALIADTYDKALFTYEVFGGLNSPMMSLQYALEYGPMINRPVPNPYILACSYPDLGPEHDSGFLLHRTDVFFFGRLPGTLHSTMMDMYNYYVDRDIMLGRPVMSFEDFINPEHKFIYDPSLYEKGYPFDPNFLVTPKLSMIADTSRAKQIQETREKKKLFDKITYVDSVAKIY